MKRFDTSRVRVPGTNLRGWRAIALWAVALYVLVFVVLNNRRIEVNFVFFKVRSNELLALILVVVLSFAAGFIVSGRRSRPSRPDPGTAESDAAETTSD